MKIPIQHPAEVAATSSTSVMNQLSCESNLDHIDFIKSNDENDRASQSSTTDSESYDTECDYDENDIPYHDSEVGILHDTTPQGVLKSNNNAKKDRSVSFGPIHIRQYERIIGDHPDTKVGVPLSIGWSYYEDERYPNGISIERYECDKIHKRTIRMSSITRRNILVNVFGVSEKEIRSAEKRSKKFRKEREKIKMLEQGTTQTQATIKRIGNKIKKGGFAVIKGMAFAAQNGIGVGSGLAAAAEHAF